MPSFLPVVLRFLAAAAGGYLLIATGQILVLEVALKGQVHPDSPASILTLAEAGTIASGLVGGFAVAWLGSAHPSRYVAGVIGLLALDAISIIVKDSAGDPLWYSLAGALTLMAATAVGGWIRTQRRPTANASLA